jgi:hypothetical protein
MYLACAPGADSVTRLAAEAQRWNVTPVSEFGVGGSASDISAGIAPYSAAGLDTIVLQPIGDEADTPDFLDAVTAVVRAWSPSRSANG